MMEQAAQATYPVRLEVDRPVEQSRWKALFRIFLALPVIIFAVIVGGEDFPLPTSDERDASLIAGAAGAVILAIWITIILRQNIPRWLFDFLVSVHRFEVRAIGYLCLLTDEYPPFEGDHSIRYEVEYPERVSRWRVLIWKAITSIVHFLVLVVLALTLIVVVPIAWIAILITGRYPEGLYTYVAGVIRWGARVQAYFLSLTDEFPPFSLQAEAGPGSSSSYALSAVAGVVVVLLGIGGIITVAVLEAEEERVSVSYDTLLAGGLSEEETRVEQDALDVSLSFGSDPADADLPFLTPKEEHRLVAYRYAIDIGDEGDIRIDEDDFRLEDSEGKRRKPLLTIVDGRVNSKKVEKDSSVNVDVVFEVPVDREVAELRYDPDWFPLNADTVVYEFE